MNIKFHNSNLGNAIRRSLRVLRLHGTSQSDEEVSCVSCFHSWLHRNDPDNRAHHHKPKKLEYIYCQFCTKKSVRVKQKFLTITNWRIICPNTRSTLKILSLLTGEIKKKSSLGKRLCQTENCTYLLKFFFVFFIMFCTETPTKNPQ